MGGDRAYPFPKSTWTPSGGWWFTPRNANLNAAVILGGLAVAVGWVWSKSDNKMLSINYVKHTVQFPKSDPRHRVEIWKRIEKLEKEGNLPENLPQ